MSKVLMVLCGCWVLQAWPGLLGCLENFGGRGLCFGLKIWVWCFAYWLVGDFKLVEEETQVFWIGLCSCDWLWMQGQELSWVCFPNPNPYENVASISIIFQSTISPWINVNFVVLRLCCKLGTESLVHCPVGLFIITVFCQEVPGIDICNVLCIFSNK